MNWWIVKESSDLIKILKFNFNPLFWEVEGREDEEIEMGDWGAKSLWKWDEKEDGCNRKSVFKTLYIL